MKFNSEIYDSTIKTLFDIKRDIANSDHDRMFVDPDSDFEPSREEVDYWLKHMDLPAPCDSRYSTVYELPFEYWETIFGDTDHAETCLTLEENKEVKKSKQYQELYKIYSSVYEDLYEAAKEESAYYAQELKMEEKYYKSMMNKL